jgi:serine/threonine protein kinase
MDQQLAKSRGSANSPYYSSPELLAGGDYSHAHDTYTFGVILWEILTLQEPWMGEEAFEGGYRRGMSWIKMCETMKRVGGWV